MVNVARKKFQIARKGHSKQLCENRLIHIGSLSSLDSLDCILHNNPNMSIMHSRIHRATDASQQRKGESQGEAPLAWQQG
jgi:hypothetical protein